MYDADEIPLSGEKSESSLVEETAGEEIYPLFGGVQRESVFPLSFFFCQVPTSQK